MKKTLFLIFLFMISMTKVDAQTLDSIYVNGKTCQNDGTLESCLKSQGVEWNENTKTLTLNNYNGGAIQFHSSTDYASNNEEITLHLKGKNTITEKSGYTTLHWGDKLNGKITSDSGASLVINHERQSAANNTAVYSGGKLTITGGEITVNNNYTFDTDKDYDAIGIEARYGLFISGNTKIKINVNSDYYRSVGILVGGEGINNPEISIEKPASVEINLTAKNKLKLKDTATHPYLYVTGTTGEIIEKFIGYEDDLAIYAGASKDSAQKLVSIPDDFKDYAYLKITQEKSSVNTNDKTGDNVLSNPNTGRANVFIIIFVLIASFLITFMMYKKSVKNNT